MKLWTVLCGRRSVAVTQRGGCTPQTVIFVLPAKKMAAALLSSHLER